MGPGCEMAVIRQERNLKCAKNEYRGNGQCKPRDGLQQPAKPAIALAGRSREYLSEQGIGKPLSHRRVRGRRTNSRVESRIVTRCGSRKQEHLKQYIKMEEHE